MSATPHSASLQVRATLLKPLAALRRRAMLYIVLDGLTALTLGLIGASLAQFLLDWWLRLAPDQRALINIIITVYWAALLYRYVLAPLRGGLPDHALAIRVDRRHPGLHDQIATAVQFASGQIGDQRQNSPMLVEQVIADACAAADRVRFTDVLNHRRAAHRGGQLAAYLALILVAFLVLPNHMRAWFMRNWLMQEIPWPQRTYLAPEGFDEAGRRSLPRGDELEIEALTLPGAGGLHVPNSVTLQWRTASGRSGRESMIRVGDTRWRATLGGMAEDVTFSLVGGDERTREYQVTAIDRPQAIHSLVTITPPTYTGAAPATLEQQTVIEALHGSTIDITARASKPLRSARLSNAFGEVAPCDVPDPYTVRAVWREPSSGPLELTLFDTAGWESAAPLRFSVRVLPDAPPEITLELDAVGDLVTPQVVFAAALNIEDTYGIGAASLFVQRGETPAYSIPLDGFETGRHVFQATPRIALSELAEIAPGERLRVWAEAGDQDPSGPNVGKAGPIELSVVSTTDYLAAIAARELELRRDFERVISGQRGLWESLQNLAPGLPAGGTPAPAQSQQLATLARRQDSYAADTLKLSRAFDEMLLEMQANQVARAADERRLLDQISEPLARLAEGAMDSAARRLSGLRREADPREVAAAGDEQVEIQSAMKAILGNMLEAEGYREAIALLEEIIKDQTEIRSATSAELERQLEDLLGLEEEAPDSSESPLTP